MLNSKTLNLVAKSIDEEAVQRCSSQEPGSGVKDKVQSGQITFSRNMLEDVRVLKGICAVPDILVSSSSPLVSRESTSTLSTWDGTHEASTSNLGQMDTPDTALGIRKRKVRFRLPNEQGRSEEMSKVDEWQREDYQTLWWTRAEIASFFRNCQQQASHVRVECNSQIECLRDLYEESKTESQLSTLLDRPCSRMLMDLASSQASGVEIRGLESFLHGIVVQARLRHSSRLLMIQKRAAAALRKAPMTEHDDHGMHGEQVAQILRTRSLKTSRASRVLARVLAHGDEVQVAHMIRHELMQQQGTWQCPS